jgi:hypothetical protein
MKKYISFIIILICFGVLSYSNAIAANQGDGKKGKTGNTGLQKIGADPSQTILDINNITSWIAGNGYMAPVVGQSWNGTFPKGTIGAIYQEGIVWGGLVNDGGTPVVRVGGNTYTSGATQLTRVVRVRPDYLTADLTSDAANFFVEPVGAVTAAQIQQIKDQYARDWAEWPANLGAPYEDVDNNGAYDPNVDIPGIPGASQTIWVQYDDRNSSDVYGSPPIGLKVSETLWGYAYSGALGNITFRKVDIYYEGTASSAANSQIDSMYIVQWADPDVGTYSDDYAGCDTSLNLGYAYNGEPNDALYTGTYGLAPPAVGYDFFQGVSHYTGNPADSVIFDLKYRTGWQYTNPKPLSTFVYFTPSSQWQDPDFDYNGTLQWYNLMRGVKPRPFYPAAEVFPSDVADYTPYGVYLLDGDPVAGTGKIDGVADPKADRRICNVTGPFTLNLHDTTEIVVALVGGLGSDYLNSITVLKQNDLLAQQVYNNLFVVPSVPAPNVQTTALDGKVILNWGFDPTSVNKIESTDIQDYSFEGYDVYQLPSATSSLEDGVLLKTFDKVDGITQIFDTTTAGANNEINIPVLVENGSDNGITRTMTLTTDQFTHLPFRNGQEYYFAVTAYAFNPAPAYPFHTVKSAVQIKIVIPQQPNPGVRYNGVAGDTLAVIHSATTVKSDGSVVPIVIDPTKTNGDKYKVTFNSDGSWNLIYSVKNTTLLSNQTNQSGDGNYLILDGIQTKVIGPSAGIKSNASNEAAGMVETVYGGTTLTPSQYDAAGTAFEGNAVWHSLNSTAGSPNRYYVSAGGGGGTLDRFTRSIENTKGYNFALKFTDTTQAGNNDWGAWAFDDGEIAHVPFQLWRYDQATGDSVRLIPFLYSGGAGTPGVFGTAYTDPYFGYDATPWIYWYYDPAGYDAFAAACAAGDVAAANNFGTVEYFSRMTFGDYDGDGKIAPPGTVIKINMNAPNGPADTYSFTAPTVTSSTDLAKADVEKINVFPNPYYGFNSREVSRSQHYVTFSHLPQQATIRIFDLAGVQVNKIDKNDQTQFAKWNLVNVNNLPVASGIYVVYIDMPQLGVQKILKVAIVQEQQILPVY